MIRPSLATVLIASFAVIVASFLGATAYSQYRAHDIEKAALSIEHSLPRVRHLSRARTEALRLPWMLDEILDQRPGPGRDSARSTLEVARAGLRSEVAAVMAEPGWIGGGMAWARAQQGVVVLEDAVDGTVRALDAGQELKARALVLEIPPLADALSDELVETVTADMEQASSLAAQIERVRARSLWFAEALNAVGVVMALSVASISVRTVRSHERVSEAHRAMLEQRAFEFEQFAGRVAHDILNPLSTIELAVTLAKRTDDPARTAQSLARIERALAQTSSIVGGLLAFARAGARPEPGARADLRAVVGDAVALFRSRADDLATELCLGPLPAVAVRCSAGALTSVVSNLIGNALKYATSGPIRRIEIRAHLDGKLLVLEVADSGPGLSPELELDAVFELYVRGKHGETPGLGLGLATVKRIAEGCGGRVGVQSSPRGCTFRVELPVAAAEA